MTIQNLNPWSNLYSNGSKYNLQVKTLHWSSLCWPGFVVLLICSLTLIAVWPIIGALTSTTLLLGYLLLYWSDKYNKPSCFAAQTITLADNGVLVFDQQSSYQLLPNSRIGWLGCWLNLQSQQAECIGKTEQRFLAKQQFNAQDYARLSRFILRYNSVRSVE